MLFGILQWIVTIGKPEIYQAVSSLNHFGVCPREGHLDLTVRCFGYVKTTINKQVDINSRPMQFNRIAPNFQKLIPDFTKYYPDAIEEMDPFFPSVSDPLLQTTFLVDANHAHDLKTRRSITGLIGYVGSTQLLWFSKRQGSISLNTYSVEFSALHTVVDETQSLYYILRYLGCNIPADGSAPTRIFGENLSVILKSQKPIL